MERIVKGQSWKYSFFWVGPQKKGRFPGLIYLPLTMRVTGLPLLLSLRITDNVLTRSAGQIYLAGVTFHSCVCSAKRVGVSKGVLSLCLIPPLTHRQHARVFLCGGVCWRAMAVRWPAWGVGFGKRGRMFPYSGNDT